MDLRAAPRHPSHEQQRWLCCPLCRVADSDPKVGCCDCGDPSLLRIDTYYVVGAELGIDPSPTEPEHRRTDADGRSSAPHSLMKMAGIARPMETGRKHSQRKRKYKKIECGKACDMQKR